MAIIQAKRTTQDIIRDGRSRLNDNVGINSTNATSTVGNLLEINATEISSMWDRMTLMIDGNFLTSATGDDLDKIGQFLQEPRSASKRAIDLSTSNMNFFLDNTYAVNISDLFVRYFTPKDKVDLFDLGLTNSPTSPSELRIPAELVVRTTNGAASYTTSREVLISDTQFKDYTPLVANGAGSAYNVTANSLVTHSLIGRFPILVKITDAIKCTNEFSISNGTSTEDDGNYRFRLSNKIVGSATGNEAAIRAAALSVPGVVDISLVKNSFGFGTFTIFPRTEDPIISDGDIEAIQQIVNTAKSVGTISFVQVPEYLAVQLRLSLRFGIGADKSDIIARSRLTVVDYIVNLPEGGEIVINEIIQRVMSLDDKIIDMDILEYGFGDFDRNSRTVSGFTPLRLVNQVADWNQRWYTNSALCVTCEAGV